MPVFVQCQGELCTVRCRCLDAIGICHDFLVFPSREEDLATPETMPFWDGTFSTPPPKRLPGNAGCFADLTDREILDAFDELHLYQDAGGDASPFHIVTQRNI